jgi:hypothetical protein
MRPKGLFNRVKNKPTRRRFLVSTIRKDEDAFETAVFVANFFYMPRSLSRPDLAIVTRDKDEAWELHYKLTVRLTQEHPIRVMQDYLEPSPAEPAQD